MLIDQASNLYQAIMPFRAGDKYGPVSELLIEQFYRHYLSSGDTAVDVGVHYAIHFFPLAEVVGFSGKVIGVEANLERYDWISKQMDAKGHPGIELHNVAASVEAGQIEFCLNVSYSGYSGIIERKRFESDEVVRITVEAKTLDDIVGQRRPKFIKIDVEGAEAMVLIGAKGVLAESKPVVIFEGHLSQSAEKSGIALSDLAQALEGYAFYDLFGHPMSIDGFTNNGWNYLAIPIHETNSAAAALRSAWEAFLSKSG